MKIGLFIPTYNAGKEFERVLQNVDLSVAYSRLTIRKIIIDTYSEDDTIRIANKHGFESYSISKEEFTHGEVRRRATEYLSECDFIIFITQDVILHKESIYELVKFILNHKEMAIAYGKQVAQIDSDFFDIEDRKYNYPNESLIKRKEDISKLGIKTVFSSDAFSIYRCDFFAKVGSFPSDVHFAEDMYMAAKAINANYTVGYCANAVVTHNNKLNIKQRYLRYKNIGHFHYENSWIQSEFGKNESNGKKLVLLQMKKLLKTGNVRKIPTLIFRSFIKYLGYYCGNKLMK